MVFPFNIDKGQAHYSVDKTRSLFVAGGEDLSNEFEKHDDPRCKDILAQARQALNTKHTWIEAVEVDELEVKLIDFALSDLIRGKEADVRHFLESSADKDLFLSGVKETILESNLTDDDDDKDEPLEEIVETFGSISIDEKDSETNRTGWTALHYAACEQHPNMVKLLLDYGADPNARDLDGRTPLVYACIWGRRDAVTLLLDHGAHRTIPSVFGSPQRQRLPVDYARATKDNYEYRRSIFGEFSKENTYERDQDRRIIVRQLEDGSETQSAERNRRGTIWDFNFTSSPENPNMSTFTAAFDRPSKYKTVGVLDHGPEIPIVAAQSGWSHPGSKRIQVAGKVWTGGVKLLCEAIGFNLSIHKHDREFPGQYKACHAEKQLIAYFVDQHPPYDTIAEPYRQRLWPGLSKLMEVEPPISLKRAMIMVNRDVCHDCGQFVRHINQALGLEIKIVLLYRKHKRLCMHVPTLLNTHDLATHPGTRMEAAGGRIHNHWTSTQLRSLILRCYGWGRDFF